ncbi:MAG: Coenzyme A biosynthesis bifunctional protein CoaBC [Alphaproteobacteria bacterium MarineAlpha5_Bin8]|nr:MAG: Coenzyme A biosynthesis bifunctional protein CoaBC [Alphaproteobacteria bacterium MarineAlpha5_Bin7]PPR48206.1 MAG: Coenzyme A biosynthesis bifunctional protein CoaBC [Alphaproteobacteria bacterium MarineAlpha5_Bin8]
MNLLLIITGSIAAKKCKKIVSELSKKKIIIDIIVTNSAKKIIDINPLKKIIKGKIYLDSSEKRKKMLHIRLARKASLIVVCPATANIIAKYSNGYADDLASTTLIASDKQIVFVPAMNVEMWNNNINLRNVKKVLENGAEFIGPDYGKLSCGETGLGRLSNENKIIQIIYDNLKNTHKLKNKNCIVTAGPTIEEIDSVRYISNYSSGKQGYEIAKQLILSGANVTLVSGPTNLQPPTKTKIIKVKTAKEMNRVVQKYNKFDIAIFTAAVSDISPIKTTNKKIKKNQLKNIILKNNPDIIKNFSKKTFKKNNLIIGFAAETNNHILNAKEKMISKGCDLIVVNKINKINNVFNSDYNRVSIIDKTKIEHFKKMTKKNVAKILVNKIINIYMDK